MSTASAGLEQELASILQTNFISTCCVVAVSSMLLYDYILTFSSEVELFWHRPTKALSGTVIFMLNRVVALGLLILGNVDTDLTQYTYGSCKYVGLADVSIELLAYALWAAVSAIRVHALTKRNWLLSIFTLALALVPMAMDMWLVSTIVWSVAPIGYLDVCSEGSPISVKLNEILLVTSRVCSMSSDLVVLLVTLYYVSPRPWVRARLSSRSISRVLLRNGILYFCVLAILNALEIILYLTSTTDYVNIFIAPTSTVVIARFLLNIREAAYAPDTTFKSTNSHDLSISTQSESDSGTGMWQSLDFTTKANDYSQGTLSSGTDVGSYDRYLYADDAEFEMYTLPMAPRGKGATQNRVAAVVPQPEHAAQ